METSKSRRRFSLSNRLSIGGINSSKASDMQRAQTMEHFSQKQQHQHAQYEQPVENGVILTAGDERVFPSEHLDIVKLYEIKITAENAEDTLRHIEILNYDDRLMIANSLLAKLEAFLLTCPEGSLKARLQTQMNGVMKEELDLLRRRGLECKEAAEDLAGTDGWTLATKMFGFSTYIRFEDGQLFVKVEGEAKGVSVFDQLMIVREGNMYNRWGPFVCDSSVKKGFKDLDRLIHFDLSAPLLHRDCIVRGYACDYSEKDMVLICGDPATPEEYPELDNLPKEPNTWMFKRMTIKRFRCQVQLYGLDAGKVILAAVIDPKAALPQAVTNFAIKQIIGILLYLIMKTAKLINDEGHKKGTLGADFVEQVRQDPYYAKHLLPRILWYCKQKGWTWPGHQALPAQAHQSVRFRVVSREEEGMDASVTSQSGSSGGAGAGGQQKSSSSSSSKKKKKNNFLSGMFRKGKKSSKAKRPATVMEAISRRMNSPLRGAGTLRSPPRGLSQESSSSSQQAANNQQYHPDHSHSHRRTPQAEQGDILAWVLPILVLTYAFTRCMVGPVVRALSGPVGEAVVLAVLIQQTISLLLKNGQLDPGSIPGVRHFAEVWDKLVGTDLSYAALTISLGFTGWSVIHTTAKTHTLTLREGVSESAWTEITTAKVHMLNTGLFVFAMLLIVIQPPTRVEVKKLMQLFR